MKKFKQFYKTHTEDKNLLYVHYKKEEPRYKDSELFLQTGQTVWTCAVHKKMQIHKHKIISQMY